MAKTPKTNESHPLDLDKILTRDLRNRIVSMGVELEGGWKVIPEDTQLQVDTSVFKNNVPPGLQCGELAIGPISRISLAKAIKKYYPDKVDHTCGLHFHMKMENLYQYMLLADSSDYQDTMIEYAARWGKEAGLPDDHALWPRLRGESIYCQKKFWPQAQMETTRKDHDQKRFGHRYTMIHYCFGRYNTVECRMLPMMETPEQSFSVINRLLNVTNAYLLAVNKKKAKEMGRVELDNGDIYEEFTEVKV